MRFKIEKTRTIKPMLIRYSVLEYDQEDNIAGEYDIALNIEEYIEFDIGETHTNININAVGVQQALTTAIADMQVTSRIASGFVDMEWIANEPDDEQTSEEVNEDGANTGDTIQLQPYVSGSN